MALRLIRRRVSVLVVLFLLLAAYFVFYTTPLSVPLPLITTEANAGAIVSLASSLARFNLELPITLHSLLQQSIAPKQIHLYLPLDEKEQIQKQLHDKPANDQLLEAVNNPLVKLLYVEDLGPATKFIPVIAVSLHVLDDGGS